MYLLTGDIHGTAVFFSYHLGVQPVILPFISSFKKANCWIVGSYLNLTSLCHCAVQTCALLTRTIEALSAGDIASEMCGTTI